MPDADVFRTTARADSVRAITNASSSPMTASSPGLYSDDGLDNDLATIEIADLTENPQDVREYAPRIMAYFRDLEVRSIVCVSATKMRTNPNKRAFLGPFPRSALFLSLFFSLFSPRPLCRHAVGRVPGT